MSYRTWLNLLLYLGSLLLCTPAIAQITPDSTLGAESSQVNSGVAVPTGIGTLINGGALRGVNLFHSFSEFNINSGQLVYFASPTNIENIFSRITGGNISRIDGTLGVAGTANLFLLNPNGILFGPNARLDIQSSFLATTANSFQFPNGLSFSATNPQGAPLLTVNVPPGLQYNTNATGTIQVRGGLETGQNLTLAATNLDIQGDQIPDTSVDDSGYARPDRGFLVAEQNLTLQATNAISLNQAFLDAATNGSIFIRGNTITSHDSLITTLNNDGDGNISIEATAPTGTAITLVNTTLDAGFLKESGGPGTIAIAATNRGNILLQQGIAFNDNDGDSPDAGGIQISGGDITLDDFKLDATVRGNVSGAPIDIDGRFITLSNGSTITTDTTSVANGIAGDIYIKGNHLAVTGNSQITARVSGAQISDQPTVGTAGRIDIDIAGTTLLDGSDTRISSSIEKNAIGVREETEGGRVTVKTGSLTIDNGARVTASTSGIGDAGRIEITASGPVSLERGGRISTAVRPGAVGNGGQIILTANALSLSSGSSIEGLVGEGSSGNAGSIAIRVTGDTQLSGPGTQITSLVSKNARGSGGSVFLNTNNFTLKDGAEINATLDGEGDRAGSITINATNQFDILNGARIIASKASNEGSRAGDIILTARDMTLDTNAAIIAESVSGGGGDIKINVSDLFLMRRNSFISTTAGSPGRGGNGGNITIDAREGFLVTALNENNDIIANAFGGRGGKIEIKAIFIFGFKRLDKLNSARLGTVRSNRTSDISASSDVGADGVIDLGTLQVNPGQGLAELPVEVVDPGNQVAQGCQPGKAEVAKQRGEFLVTGRGGLAPGADDPQIGGGIAIPWVQQSSQTETAAGSGQQADRQAITNPTASEQLVEAQTIAIAPDGKPMLTAQGTAATPHSIGFQSLRCDDGHPVTNRTP